MCWSKLLKRRPIHHFSVIGAVLCAALASPSVAFGDWLPPTGPLNATPDNAQPPPSIASIDGAPYVAYRADNVVGATIHVQNFSGNHWQELGFGLGAEGGEGNGSNPSLAIAGSGGCTPICNQTPYVAWEEAAGNGSQIRVDRFFGGDWTEVGGPLDPGGGGSNPRITISGGESYVAWQQTSGNVSDIRVARLTGGTWSPLGLPLNPGVSASHPSIALVHGVPYLAWAEMSTSGVAQLLVDRFSDGAWQAVGGPLNVDASRSVVDLSLTSVNDLPYVAWSEGSGSYASIHVKRLLKAGSSRWGLIGPDPLNPSHPFAGHPSIRDIGGNPTITWQQSGTVTEVVVEYLWEVRRPGGGFWRWRPVGGPLNSSDVDSATFPSLADVDGFPWVTWVETATAAGDPGFNEIRVKRWVPPYRLSQFTLASLVRNLRSGRASMRVHVPAGGSIGLFGLGVKTVVKKVNHKGAITLRIIPRGSVAKELKGKGKARVRLSVSYAPLSGFPETKAKLITLKRG